LLIRINAVLIIVFAIATFGIAIVLKSTLEANAAHEVLNEAGLIMDSAAAIRSYTSTEIVPLLTEKMKEEFRPQSVPSYAATQNFLKLHAQHPDYAYKEATLNPTNLRDRAADWEADIVQKFRNDAGTKEVTGERDSSMGPTLYLARPIRALDRCLPCHSVPANAPATLIARYGSNNGFGWQAGEVVAAQIVSVPVASASARADLVLNRMIFSLIAMFVAVMLIINAALYVLVVRPVKEMARVADQLSLGNTSVPEFSTRGGHEVATLAVSLNRMHKSLDKALRLLER
jgi:HAMP domain-containing protein